MLLPMKVVGRKKLADADVTAVAKRRLTLWVRQITDANWDSLSSATVSFPEASVVSGCRIQFPFAQFGLAVISLLNFELGIVYVDEIIELKIETR